MKDWSSKVGGCSTNGGSDDTRFQRVSLGGGNHHPVEPYLPLEVIMGTCVYCGRPFAGVFAYTGADGEPRYVHYACQDEYVKQQLRGFHYQNRTYPKGEDDEGLLRKG